MNFPPTADANSSFAIDKGTPGDAALVERAVTMARFLVARAESMATRSENSSTRRLAGPLASDAGRDLLLALTDQVARVDDPARAMKRLNAVVKGGVPDSFPLVHRVGLTLARFGFLAPRLAAPAVRAVLRHEANRVIGSMDDPKLRTRLDRTRSLGLRANLNILGEAIVGDGEAEQRVVKTIELLERADVDYVSVKASALCANLDVLAFEDSVSRIAAQLRRLYRAAMGSTPHGFVNLDMEEYRDLSLTTAAFVRVLDESEFLSLSAGIVLQAYLPDTSRVLADVGAWATRRARIGGAAVKVRLVKGANLAMEQVEAELHGWEQAPFLTKDDVDAHFKALLEMAVQPEFAAGLRVGVASHNLFDVAWAMQVAEASGATDRVEFEMLDGMAPAQGRAVREQVGDLVLYSPVVADSEFEASLAYLARRLDENATPENFLYALLSLTPQRLNEEESRFRRAVKRRHVVGTAPRRATPQLPRSTFDPSEPFANEPDADFALESTRAWLAEASQPVVMLPATLSSSQVDELMDKARKAQAKWALQTPNSRAIQLGRVVDRMRTDRSSAIKLLQLEGVKTIREADPEVAEAIDAFAYAAAVSSARLSMIVDDGVGLDAVGTVVVCGPWNFPYAIPSLGIASALIAGNAVIVKPAPEVRTIGAFLVAQLHAAGVDPDLVQLALVNDGPVGTHLVTHDQADAVVLTGSTETAQAFLAAKPTMRLAAETSGKNAIIVTQAADLDAAIKDVLRSAFGHAGQKCSAASLLIVESKVLRSATFLPRLADAARSLRVGSVMDAATVMGPLIAPANGNLLRALTALEPGESWLLEPTPLDSDDPLEAVLWSPGIRLGVQPNSWFHTTECFGPVLGVMEAHDLSDGIAMQNSTGYGLTGGLQSLDPDEIALWANAVEVGNAYVNRPITGAIVGRQPFGGWKKSSVGAAPKPGGPDHVLWFVQPKALSESESHADSKNSMPSVETSYCHAWNAHFGADADPSALRSEINLLRHCSAGTVAIFGASELEAAMLQRAAAITKSSAIFVRSEAELGERIAAGFVRRVRVLRPLSEESLRKCHAHSVAVDRTPVTGNGWIELGRWCNEQVVSVTNHRYGRVLTNQLSGPLR